MKTDRKMIQRVWSTDEPFTKVCVGEEEILIVPKDGNWEIERIFLDYWQPCDELVIIFKKKKEDGAVIKERKHGRWIKMSDSDGIYFACSICGEDLPRVIQRFDPQFDLFPKLESIDKTNYCPYCGADMREKRNDK